MDASRPEAKRLRLITVALAVGCGLTVANLYFGQPLLPEIAASFSITQGLAAIIVTATQIGYAIGLAFLLPLGDLVENRTLVSRVLIGTTVALIAAATSPVAGVFLAVCVLIGVTSVVAQILVPVAAHLAPEERRGLVVGQVMSGLLLGILLARSVSSLVASVAGWRAIYGLSAVLTLLLIIALRRLLPERRPEHSATYRQLLASIGSLVRDEPVLRRRAIAHAGMFGAFSLYWTAISYELVDHHGLSQLGLAVFALIGAGGAAAAPLAGSLADRGYGVPGRSAVAALGSAALVVAALGSSSVVLLALGGVALDFAVQAHQVICQRDIYSLRADARARINTVFMTTVFVSGAVASGLVGLWYGRWGWIGLALVGAAFPAVSLVFALTDLWVQRKSSERAEPAP